MVDQMTAIEDVLGVLFTCTYMSDENFQFDICGTYSVFDESSEAATNFYIQCLDSFSCL